MSEEQEQDHEEQEGGEGEELAVTASAAAARRGRRRWYRVGYALSPKKVESFIQPSLLNVAHERGIDLIQIHPNKPLIPQAPFDCILHKLSEPHWIQQLRDFSSQYPNVPIIDPPDAILSLHNRVSMLQVVNRLQIPTTTTKQEGEEEEQQQQQLVSFGIPHQVLVQDSQQLLSDHHLLNFFPLIAKPLVADGTANSHQMSLVFNQEGLKALEAPLVLQEFVNHGGVVFKVYVAGNYVQCVKRRSLPDISPHKLHHFNLLSFSQISNLNDHDHDHDHGDDTSSELIEAAQMPPVSFLTQLAHALRNALSLHLFNFDVIRDTRFGNRYLVIDINYFPGYAKMPSYETVLTDFFLDILHHHQSVS